MDKTILLKTMENTAIRYDKFLNHKIFLILCKKESNIHNYNVLFNETNFLHLTGVKSKLTPLVFYNACLGKKLTIKDFECKYNDKIMKQKMNALQNLELVPKLARLIGDYNNNGFKLKTDKIWGNNLISLGLVFDWQNRNYLAPNSLLEADAKTLTQMPYMPIIAILSKDIKDKQFDTITYKSKNINIDKLHFPADIQALLTENALYQLKPSLQEATQSISEIAVAKENKPVKTTIPMPKIVELDNDVEIISPQGIISEPAKQTQQNKPKADINTKLKMFSELSKKQNSKSKPLEKDKNKNTPNL